MPTLTAGAELSLAVTRPRYSVEAFGTLYAQQERDTQGSSTSGGTFTLRTFGARACAVLAPGDLNFAACLDGSLNQLSARGFGVSEPSTARTNVGGVGLAVRTELRLGEHAGLRLDAGPTYMLGDANFVLAGVGAVYRITRFDAGGSLKFAWRF